MGSHGASAVGSGNPFAELVMLCPLAYFAICFCTSFGKRKERRIFVAGIVAHVCLAAFVLAGVLAGDIGGLFVVAGLVCTIIWVSMYSTLDESKAA